MLKLRSTVVLAAAAGALVFAGAGTAGADAGAQGAAFGSPGVLSGNVVQIPIHIPINVCGNSINVIGLLNPSFGNSCVNGGGHDRARDEHQNDKGSEGYTGNYSK
ncbi:chaplin [uncultured Streptomyces sp.]|uniref:chaplin n=1 Tax=uncultured Streptomyces sp. TaxID=174707 RepID=UPI002628CE0E|nr:chaplin [uncultured Streptomyces sp.]